VWIGRALGGWAALAAAMTANGIVREAVLVRATGRSRADVLSAALGEAIVLCVSRPFLRPLAGRSGASPAAVAALWLGLTLTFESAIGRLVDRRSWSDLLADYAIWRGRLWPLVLATVVAAPFVWMRRRSGFEDSPLDGPDDT
jgi:hypothetical protein